MSEGECCFRGCTKPRVNSRGEVYDFCITHILRIDRKIGLRAGFVASLASMTIPTATRPDVKSAGVVYFMLVGDEVKIGFTTNLKRRASELRAGRVLAYFAGDRTAERAAHDAFAAWHTRGEYFDASPECLAAIQRLAQAN